MKEQQCKIEAGSKLPLDSRTEKILKVRGGPFGSLTPVLGRNRKGKERRGRGVGFRGEWEERKGEVSRGFWRVREERNGNVEAAMLAEQS